MDTQRKRTQEAMDVLVSEIAVGDGDQVAPSVRMALERGWATEFPRTLAEVRRKKEEEIRRLCERYYGEFLGSVQQLLSMRGNVNELNHGIQGVHDAVSTIGPQALAVVNDLERLQHMRNSIDEAMEVVAACKEIAVLMVRTTEQINEPDHYGALDTIEQLKGELHSIAARPFQAHLQRWLPTITNQLITSAKEELKHWLNRVCESTYFVGLAAMRRCAAACAAHTPNIIRTLPCSYSLIDVHRYASVFRLQRWVRTEDLEATLPRVLYADDQPAADDVLDNITDTLHPIHRSLHMYARLGRLDELKRFYSEARSSQARLQSLVSFELQGQLTEKEFETAMLKIFCKMCGFFVTESVSRQTVQYPDGLLSWQEITELWEVCCDDVNDFVVRNLVNVTSPIVILRIKEMANVLSVALADEAVGLRTAPLVDICRVMWNDFKRLQAASIEASCRQLLSTSHYQPLQINTEREYEQYIRAFKLEGVQVDGGSQGADALIDRIALRTSVDESTMLPRAYPFSEAVPAILRMLHVFLLQFFIMSSHIAMRDQGRVVSQVFVGAVDKVCACMAQDIDQDKDVPLSKVTQIYIDSVSLSQAYRQFRVLLDELLSHYNWTDISSKEIEQLVDQARGGFDNVAVRARDIIFELITLKIEELLESMYFVAWEPTSPPQTHNQYVEDVMGYLRVTFMWLTHLPLAVREAVHFASCARVASGIQEHLLDGEQRINGYSLMSIRRDVTALESFAEQCGIAHLKQCFVELHQLLDAALSSELANALQDPHTLQTMYPTLNPSKLAKLIDKTVPVSIGARARAGGLPIFELDKKTASKLVFKLRSIDR